MKTRLVVISGPANSGKLPLAKALMEKNPELVLVHRDALRDAIVTKVDEWTVTQAMGALTGVLLNAGHPVVVCAWNLEPQDRDLWVRISGSYAEAPLEWLDTRKPEVHARIPPLEGWNPVTH